MPDTEMRGGTVEAGGHEAEPAAAPARPTPVKQTAERKAGAAAVQRILGEGSPKPAEGSVKRWFHKVADTVTQHYDQVAGATARTYHATVEGARELHAAWDVTNLHVDGQHVDLRTNLDEIRPLLPERVQR